ncbi:PREDICTED: TOX high mobility group box family member 4 isoform X3 [Mandrillus leucophaeus]|uniref:TOX high mobility group box family member 4 isoform X3 n=1 Tax=Mandrillus leucophaeus TaxID=9568 RepID=UPI0005F3D462|nr:PREDICTED: TOX high mobility group box family member 4 isoform X3 [Mandrillus leucophaeus]
MEFPGGNDNYLTITGPSHPFLSGAETFHTPSLGDEEFEIPPISLDSDPSLAVSDVVGHFDDLADPSSSQDGSFSAQYGVQTLDHSIGTQYSANPPVTIDVPMTDMTSGLMGHSQLTTIDQSELSSQLGLSLGGGTILPPAQSPEDRLSTTPSPTSSLHEDGVEDFRRQLPSQKTVVVEAGKKQKAPKKRKKKDPNEPQKPVSAYALFFRDTQAAIKGQNPNATFGEVSKIVASMWDSLGEEQKQVYKRKTEAAKKEYLKALAAYKDNQECQATVETVELDPAPPSQTPSPPPMATVDPASPAPASIEPPALSPSIVVNSTLSSYVANQASSGAGGQPNITKLIITKQMLPSSITMSQGGMVTVIPATVVTSRGLQLGQTSTATIQPSQQAQIVTRSVLQAAAAAAAAASMQLPPPRLQPPPLQQMPQPPTQQQVTILQQPPPLQAMQQPPPQKVRINLQQQPPPLQIKSVPLPTLKMQTTLVPPTVESSPERPMNNSPEAHTVEATSPETICEMITDVVPEVESPSQMDVELVSGSPVALSPQPRCVRSGCDNPPIVSKDWDNEYCSNECVVKHCRDVFLAWVASRNSNTVVFVK